MAEQPNPPKAFTDTELRSMALLNVGYASEVGLLSSGFKLDLAWPTDKKTNTIYRPANNNSGYSLGLLQNDFGQRQNLVGDLVSKYALWAGNDPNRLLSITEVDLENTLKSDGKTLERNQSLLSHDDKAKFNQFLKTDEGKKASWEMNFTQTDNKLLPFAKNVIATPLYQNLTDEKDKVVLLSTAMKLYNQNETNGNTLLREVKSGRLASLSDIETKFTTAPYSIDVINGFKNAKAGAELYSKIDASNSVLSNWLRDQSGTDLASLPYAAENGAADYKHDQRFQVLNRLFRDPVNGAKFLENLEQNKPMLMTAPNHIQDGTVKMIGIDKNGDIFTADPNGKNVNQFINGTWVQKDGGEPVIKQNQAGKWVLALGKTEIDFGSAKDYAENPNQDTNKAAVAAISPKEAAEVAAAERELRATDPKAFRTAIKLDVIEDMLNEKGELSELTPQRLEQKTAQHLWRINEDQHVGGSRREFATDLVEPQSKTGNYDVDPKKLKELVQLAQTLPDGALKDELNQRAADFLNDSGAKVAVTQEEVSHS